MRIHTYRVLIGFGLFLLSSARLSADSFTDEMTTLQKEDVSKVGRDSLVKGYEQIIRDHSSHPERAKPMMELASLWQMEIPSTGITRNSDQEIHWLREACANAIDGSPDWFEARFRLVGATYLGRPEEPRRILQEIIDRAPASGRNSATILIVRSLYNLQMIAENQKEYGEAERICRQLQNWDIQSKDMPEDISEKGDVYKWIQDSASSMVMCWASMMDVPKQVRKSKIEEFRNNCRVGCPHLENSATNAIQYLDKLLEPVPNVDRRTPAGTVSNIRNWALALNLCAIAILLTLILFRTKYRKAHEKQ